MKDAHLLDRPVWNALTTRQSALGCGDDLARRYLPRINMFAAGAVPSAACAAAVGQLLPQEGAIGLVERAPFPSIPGARVEKEAIVNQMVANHSPGISEGFAYLALGDDDAAEMLALASLTQPGPFFSETHRMGISLAYGRVDGWSQWPDSACACQASPKSARCARILIFGAGAMPAI